MKIKELLHEAPLTDRQEEEFLSKMQQTKYMNSEKELKNIRPTVKKSGEGGYSKVFSDPRKETVVKISKIKDTGAINYLRWCIKNQKNPHVPKILGLHVSPDKTFLYARMEKLVSANANTYKWSQKDIPILSYLLFNHDLGILDMEDIFLELIDQKYGYDYSKSAEEYYDDGIDLLKKNKKLMADLKKSWITDPFVTLIKTLPKIKGRFDFLDFLFSGRGDFRNVMLRPSTNTLVLTDPLAGEHT